MSFRFNWPDFDSAFYAEVKTQLETALNKAQHSKHIVAPIKVDAIHMGDKPPELEILEIGDLSSDAFRGIFRLAYKGNAFIVLQTDIEANPLCRASPWAQPHLRGRFARHMRPTMVAANKPLRVPMQLRISDVELDGLVVLAVSKSKGVTLVFKNDPLQKLEVSSTFDIVPTIKQFLLQTIEANLRHFLAEQLPLVIHAFSLKQQQNQQNQQQNQQNQHEDNAMLAARDNDDNDDAVSLEMPPTPTLSCAASTISDDDSMCWTPTTTSLHPQMDILDPLTPSSSSSSLCAPLMPPQWRDKCTKDAMYGDPWPADANTLSFSSTSRPSSQSSRKSSMDIAHVDAMDTLPREWNTMEAPDNDDYEVSASNRVFADIRRYASSLHTLSLADNASPSVLHKSHPSSAATMYHRTRKNKVPRRRVIVLANTNLT
ncbi:hypothetical protein BC940DRAFT_53416 [Gongronella butleri]|nr:hypothetical protein BC940DRAFT_53416 [Gongronella butleri]